MKKLFVIAFVTIALGISAFSVYATQKNSGIVAEHIAQYDAQNASTEPAKVSEGATESEEDETLKGERLEQMIQMIEEAAGEQRIADDPIASEALKTRSMGDPNAPIKIEEFASLTCGHCADFHNNTFPELKEKYIDTGKVYFTFSDFPLNAAALEGAMIARCLPENRYFQYISFLFETQQEWAFSPDYQQQLRQSSKLLGMTDERFDDCLASEALREGLAGRMQDAGSRLGISSTPTFSINNGQGFINGAQGLENFTMAIDQLLPEENN